MGQKVNPHGLRVGVIKDWDSRWFADKKAFGDILVEDYKVRNFIKEELKAAGIPRVEIERDALKVRIHIHCAKPGQVIGQGGAKIDKLRQQVEAMIGKPVHINIVQLEKRISFRRAMKQCIGRTMRLGAKGIKTCVSGRLGGAEIARTEHYEEGTVPLQTLRADIDYGFAEANTTYGKIGVKVWIYTGEVLKGEVTKKPARAPRDDRRSDRRDDRPRNNRRPRSEGGNK